MRKTLTAAMAAITLGGALCATAAPAQAHDWDRGWHGGRYYHRDHDDNGAAIAAGVVGLALGAALASNGHSHSYYYDRPYYRGGYYDSYYDSYYAPAYRVCESERWVWDPYIGRRVPIRERYAC